MGVDAATICTADGSMVCYWPPKLTIITQNAQASVRCEKENSGEPYVRSNTIACWLEDKTRYADRCADIGQHWFDRSTLQWEALLFWY